jgi:hypothetical protein
MTRSLKLATVCAIFLLAASLSASACSGDCFSNVNLVGNSGGNAGGSFTFNSSTDTFSNLSLSFNGGVFSGLTGLDAKGGKGICVLGICEFSWQTTLKNGDTVWETILLNVKTGQYQDQGGIYNWKNEGGFNYLSVAEGGNSLAYLLVCGMALFAAIVGSRKRRHAVRAV